MYSNKLELVGRERARETAQRIGELAGGDAVVTELARRVGNEMIGPERYAVHAALQALSELAMKHYLEPQSTVTAEIAKAVGA